MGAASLGDMWARSVWPGSFLSGWAAPLCLCSGCLSTAAAAAGEGVSLLCACCASCGAEAAVGPLALQIWLVCVLSYRCRIKSKARRKTASGTVVCCRCGVEPQEEEEGRQVCFVEGAGDGKAGSAGDCFCSSTGHRRELNLQAAELELLFPQDMLACASSCSSTACLFVTKVSISPLTLQIVCK